MNIEHSQSYLSPRVSLSFHAMPSHKDLNDASGGGHPSPLDGRVVHGSPDKLTPQQEGIALSKYMFVISTLPSSDSEYAQPTVSNISTLPGVSSNDPDMVVPTIVPSDTMSFKFMHVS